MATVSWRFVPSVSGCCPKKQSFNSDVNRRVQCGLAHAFSRRGTWLQFGSLHFNSPRSPKIPSLPLVPIRAKTEGSAEALGTDSTTQVSCSNTDSSRVIDFKRGPWSRKDVSFASFIFFLHGLCLFAPFTFTWSAFGVFLGLYFTTGLLGITLSYHRNLAHKSFKLPKWLEYTFAYFGAQALQGDPLEWVNVHRGHHQHCDSERDPHSPLVHGFWYSHIGWIFDSSNIEDKVPELSNVKDLAGDPFYKFLARTYILHPLMLAAVLYATGGVPYIVWGMAVRIVWVYHITWLVNSAAHIWGTQQWNTGDLSRNNWWVALLAFGEGWHNNHHAFEYSARHGLEWWQIDMTWYLVRLLQSVGLATKVRLPSKEHKLKFSL